MDREQLFQEALDAYAQGDYQRSGLCCEQALQQVTVDALTVRLIHLQLTATELWWTPNPAPDIGRKIEHARTIADSLGEPGLRALAANLLGCHLIVIDGLPEAIAVFAEAAELARASGNVLAELQALSNLGHHSVGRDLDAGMAILRQAQALADRQDQVPPADLPLVKVLLARLDGLIGVAAFDDGRFGEGESALRRSLDGLRTAHARDQFAMIANYLGQLLTAAGRFQEAEDLLIEALDILMEDADLSTHQAYNLGLLGKLYLEWGRLDAAEDRIRAGWHRIQRTGHQAIVPILRNYLGELLIHPDNPARDLEEARRLFDETISECLRSGFQRSEISALAFLALADLGTGDLPTAEAASAQAVRRLEETGTMPALRTEEIYLIRYQVMRSAGDPDAIRYLDLARDVLLGKADTLPTAALRDCFLSLVPTSRAILQATDGQKPKRSTEA